MNKQISDLISGLTGSEKRYIHLQLKTFSESDNISLADFISIEKSISKNLPLKKIKSNVTRLYYNIIDILAEYHRNNISTNYSDFLNLNRAKLLYYKGMNEEAEKLIDKILNIPSSDSQLIQVEAIGLRLMHAVNSGKIEYLNSQFEKDKESLRQISEEFTNLMNYTLLWAASKFETSSGYFFDKKNTFTEKQYREFLADESQARSPKAKILFNKLKGYEAIKSHDIEDAFEYTVRAIEIFQQYPELVQTETLEYLKSLRNYCIAQNFRKKHEEGFDYITQIQNSFDKKLLHKNASARIESYILFVMIKMDFLISMFQNSPIHPEFDEFEKKYFEMQEYLPQDEKQTSSYHFVLFYLNSNIPRKALKYVNSILPNTGNTRKDIYHLTLIAELVIHYRLNNIGLLESKLNSYKNFIQKNGIVFSFENIVHAQLMKILNHPEELSLYKEFYELCNDMLMKETKQIYIPHNPIRYLIK